MYSTCSAHAQICSNSSSSSDWRLILTNLRDLHTVIHHTESHSCMMFGHRALFECLSRCTCTCTCTAHAQNDYNSSSSPDQRLILTHLRDLYTVIHHTSCMMFGHDHRALLECLSPCTWVYDMVSQPPTVVST